MPTGFVLEFSIVDAFVFAWMIWVTVRLWRLKR